MHKNCLNYKGLSLVEVVVSSLVLTLVIVACFGVYRNVQKMITISFHKLTALYWVQSEVERLKNQVRGPKTATGAYRDEEASYPFNYTGSQITLTTSGCSVSYNTQFGGTAYTAPTTVPYYGAAIFNVLKDNYSGQILSRVDGNTTNTAQGWRQITVWVQWTEP